MHAVNCTHSRTVLYFRNDGLRGSVRRAFSTRTVQCSTRIVCVMLLDAHVESSHHRVLNFGNHSAPGAACSQTRCHHELHACTCSLYRIITQHVTVVIQLANPRHPRPGHISRYCPLSRSNITQYGPDFDPECNNKNGKKCW